MGHKELILLSFLSWFTSCKERINYYSVPLQSSYGTYNAVIEIPAGTNKKYEYNKSAQAFELDQINGKDRVIQFLPYLGNYGYIPSTFSDPETGGDGDAIDVLVLSESVEIGSVLETKPIAILKLLDDGEIDYKVIAVPSDTTKQIIKTSNFKNFSKDFAEVKTIIELWFLNYNKNDEVIIEGWGDEKDAINEINKHKK